MFSKETGLAYSPTIITSLIESDAGKTETLDEVVKKSIFEQTVQPLLNSNKTMKEAFEVMQILEENPKAVGRHPCGIVLSSRPLELDVPMARTVTKRKGDDGEKIIEYITQYDMEDIDKCGLIKIDALGLETLDLVDRCIKTIKERHKIDIDLSRIPINDGDVFDFLTNTSAYEGLFQMSNSGYTNMVRKMRPDCIEDIMASMALYRPGSIRSGATDIYVSRKSKREMFSHPIDKLTPILAETQGVLIYQESIQQICHILCGWSLARSDEVRKIVGKKLLEKIDKLGEDFVKDATSYSPECTPDSINKVFASIKEFAKYGFNKSIIEETFVLSKNGKMMIKDLKPNLDKVLTLDHNNDIIETEVINLYDHGILDCYEVSFEDGSTVGCTMDHKFMTEEGMLPLHEIITRDLGVQHGMEM